MLKFLHIIVLFAIIVSSTNGARILGFFPMPSISHQVAFRPLTQELARRGHEVTVITTDPAFPKGQTPKNLREIDVHDISYDIWRKNIASYTTGSKNDLTNQMKISLDLFNMVVKEELLSPEVQALLNNKNETFDLLLLELCARPALVLSHFYKVPVIQMSSFGGMFGTYELVGAPTHPLLYPMPIRQKVFDLTFTEKIIEVYNHFYYYNIFNTHEEGENAMIRNLFGKDTPPLSELANNVHMLFLNINPIWEHNRPVPPNVIYMGGVHQKPEKELPQDLKTYLDSSKHGVIYFSLGTNVLPSALPPQRMQILVNVFSKLPYDILWKYDKDEIPGRPSNVRLQKWLPQADLLRHPKIKLFIMQGGLQSTDEAITAGVPLVALPMLGDQWYNAEQFVHHKIGIRLDFETITEDAFKNAIDTVIGDKSYRQNILKLRDVMHDQPQSPLERTVWWTEHVLRHGGADHLRSPAANMPWTQYYEIELVSIVLGGLLSIVLLALYTLYALWKYLRSSFVTSVKIKKS